MKTREELEMWKADMRARFVFILKDLLNTKEKQDIWKYWIYAIWQIDRLIKSMCDLKLHKCLNPHGLSAYTADTVDSLYTLQWVIEQYIHENILEIK